MTQFFRNASSIALILALTPAVFAGSGTGRTAESDHRINVRLYDYADVRSPVLAKAQSEAARVLRRAGIETNWVGCAVPGRVAESKPVCNARPEAIDIQVRILPRKMAQKLMKHYSEFGLAFTAPGDGFGPFASIFYHRVEELSARRHTPRSLLLGHLIAHEIGHLLLGSNSHSRSGIMHVPWNQRQVERASLGTLLFSSPGGGKDARVKYVRQLTAAEQDLAGLTRSRIGAAVRSIASSKSLLLACPVGMRLDGFFADRTARFGALQRALRGLPRRRQRGSLGSGFDKSALAGRERRRPDRPCDSRRCSRASNARLR